MLTLDILTRQDWKKKITQHGVHTLGISSVDEAWGQRSPSGVRLGRKGVKVSPVRGSQCEVGPTSPARGSSLWFRLPRGCWTLSRWLRRNKVDKDRKKNANSTSWSADLEDLVGRWCLGTKIAFGVGVEVVDSRWNPTGIQTNLVNAGIQSRVMWILANDPIWRVDPSRCWLCLWNRWWHREPSAWPYPWIKQGGGDGGPGLSQRR
jgi:hypothetical protein